MMNERSHPKSVRFYSVMEAYSTATNYSTPMESYRHKTPPTTSTSPQGNTDGHSSPRNVTFGKATREEEKEKRQKFLTARFGQHQMSLIRKRLAVEDWLYDMLRDMYDCTEDDDDHDCRLDLEDILNLDTDSERSQYAHETLTDAKKPPDLVNKFVKDLLQKAKTL